jgi:ubiquinone biosynthesis protein Coq4
MQTIKLSFQKYSLREKLIETLFNASVKPYQFLRRRRTSWQLNRTQLLAMPVETLGHDVGQFLEAHDFHVMDKCESHDVFHVLLNYPTDVPNEIGMQYFLLGNGRHSWYTWLTVLLGGAILPEHLGRFTRDLIKGKHCPTIKHWDLQALLVKKTKILRGYIFKKKLFEAG